jgi:hypothetical protein
MSADSSKPSIPGAGSSILWGLAGLIFFAVPLLGVACGIVAIIKSQTAKVLLKGREDEFLGGNTARLGFRLGITAVVFAHLCYLVVAVYMRQGMAGP